MKHILHILTVLIAVLSFSTVDMAAQAKIHTKKVRISDFTSKTTKVVLGEGFVDGALKEEVSSRWRVSPYEFCTQEEYKALKENPSYYFLFIGTSEDKDLAGMKVLTLMKGGLKNSEDPDKVATEIVSIPISASEFPSGREMVMMSAFVDIMQDYAKKAMKSDVDGYGGLGLYMKNVRRSGHKSLVFSEDDLSPEMNKSLMDNDTRIVSEEEADKTFEAGTYNTLVSFVVCPNEPRNGDSSYQMLIDAETHELFYFDRHKINSSRWAGFDDKDMKAINAPRKKYNK